MKNLSSKCYQLFVLVLIWRNKLSPAHSGGDMHCPGSDILGIHAECVIHTTHFLYICFLTKIFANLEYIKKKTVYDVIFPVLGSFLLCDLAIKTELCIHTQVDKLALAWPSPMLYLSLSLFLQESLLWCWPTSRTSLWPLGRLKLERSWDWASWGGTSGVSTEYLPFLGMVWTRPSKNLVRW